MTLLVPPSDENGLTRLGILLDTHSSELKIVSYCHADPISYREGFWSCLICGLPQQKFAQQVPVSMSWDLYCPDPQQGCKNVAVWIARWLEVDPDDVKVEVEWGKLLVLDATGKISPSFL